MIDKIKVICIASSYGVALLLEISRLFFRAPVNRFIPQGFIIAGLIAHSLVLWRESEGGFAAGLPFVSWHIWYLLAAWLLTMGYFTLALRRPETALGVFMLPVVLALVAAANLARRDEFAPARANEFWATVHGLGLLLGTVVTAFGFTAGAMYLVQSYRLKNKMPPNQGLKLPSLEWLQMVNKQSLYWSSFFVAVGMLAGIVLNLLRQGVPWNDRVVISSGVLLAWLFGATLFELFYKPAQQGRKVAYLTIVSFVFLALVLGLALTPSSQHAVAPPAAMGGEMIP